MNIVDAILFQCRRQPPVAAICVPGQDRGLISYRRLEQSIHNVSRKLLSLGLAPGSIVAVNIQDMIFHATVLLASIRLGFATLSIRDGVPPLPFKIDALISDAQAPASPQDRIALADPSWMEGDGQEIERRYVAPTSDNTIFRLALTSESTGVPKAVAITQRLLLKRVARHLTVFGNRLPRCDRFYSDLPIETSLGFQFLIYSLLRGGTMVFPGARFDTTLQAIEDYNVQCLVAASDGLDAFVRGFGTIPAYQSNLELIVHADDGLSAALSNEARARICSHLVSAYDSAETGTIASAGAHELVGKPGAVGFVTPDTTVEIIDQSGALLPPGKEGLIRIKSGCAVDGYVGLAEETTTTFRNGWLYPGDIGSLDDDNCLVITGSGGGADPVMRPTRRSLP
jgi:acyl-coenzyme A synthetase/AMP-(fatty) acid ligase